MVVDVACVGDPFLDLIFLGLPAIPAPGEEQLASRLVMVPGGMANVAYALGRLELATVVCAPIGRDPAGRLLGELMREAGITWVGRDDDVTPVSVSLPADGDRAFVTVSPEARVDVATLDTLDPRAIVVNLPSASEMPPRSRTYAVVGDPEVAAMRGRLPSDLAGIRAVILNEREARGLTGDTDALAAATVLAELGTTVVMTRGADGAMAVEPGGRPVSVSVPKAALPDTTGAGDLFAAAYVWADLAGHPLDERLRLATRYATLSLSRPTGRQKGIDLREFRAASAGEMAPPS